MADADLNLESNSLVDRVSRLELAVQILQEENLQQNTALGAQEQALAAMRQAQRANQNATDANTTAGRALAASDRNRELIQALGSVLERKLNASMAAVVGAGLLYFGNHSSFQGFENIFVLSGVGCCLMAVMVLINREDLILHMIPFIKK
jgi:hypothetical protein